MPHFISRKAFCGSALGGVVLMLLPACGGGETSGDSTPSAGGGSPTTGCGNTFDFNHGHVLVVTLADLDSLSNRTYDIRGSADHAHTVTLTVAQLGTLKTGRSVTVTSSNSFHEHVITVTCG